MAVNSIDVREDRYVSENDGLSSVTSVIYYQGVVDFTSTPYGNEVVFISRNPEMKPTYLNVTKPFSLLMWGIFLASFLIFSAIIAGFYFVYSKRSKYSNSLIF